MSFKPMTLKTKVKDDNQLSSFNKCVLKYKTRYLTEKMGGMAPKGPHRDPPLPKSIVCGILKPS